MSTENSKFEETALAVENANLQGEIQKLKQERQDSLSKLNQIVKEKEMLKEQLNEPKSIRIDGISKRGSYRHLMKQLSDRTMGSEENTSV